MRGLIAAAAIAVTTMSCLAQSRPSTLALSCAKARQLVARSGAITLSTGGQTYDRFVSTRGFCPTGTFARPAFVPTATESQCDIGFYCSSAPPLFEPR